MPTRAILNNELARTAEDGRLDMVKYLVDNGANVYFFKYIVRENLFYMYSKDVCEYITEVLDV